MSEWSGRRIAVAGGCGGIGRSLVESLRQQGAHVAVLDLPQSIGRYPPPASVLTYGFDAASSASVDQAFASLGADWSALDGLVNLVGFAPPPTPLSQLQDPIWTETIQGNLHSCFLIARVALPFLHAGRDAALVNVSSGLALKSSPGYGAYAASKAGMLALTRVLAQENAPQVRVNAIAPSAVETAFLTGGTGRGGDDRADRALDTHAYVQTIPMGRIATPQDVTGPILFLLSSAANYITGQTLHVNGGSLMV